MKFMRLYFLVFTVAPFFISSCNSSKSYNATTVGELEDLIKKGDMSTHIKLKDLERKPNLYAIGSVTKLKGFIVIDNSKPYTSFVNDGSVEMDSSWNTEATLLVYSLVDKWKELPVPAEINDWKKLEDYVMAAAKENDINPDVAFPFLLKGVAENISWRVSDWDPDDKVVTNKKVKNSGLKGVADQVSTTIVGFYCTKQYRVLAEHDTKMHLHFVSDDRKVSGHVDDITLDGKMKLYLPEESDGK
jgi:alpha-acetolactate decarboxylase